MAVKSKKLRFSVLRRDGFACRYCGRRAPMVFLHVDHIIPTLDGGSDDPGNLITACDECNMGKGVGAVPCPVLLGLTDHQITELLTLLCEGLFWRRQMLRNFLRDDDFRRIEAKQLRDGLQFVRLVCGEDAYGNAIGELQSLG